MTELDSTDSGTRLIATIDIGTNSIHLLVVRATVVPGQPSTGPTTFEVIERRRDMTRLGHSASGAMDELSAEAIERGVTSLRRMKRIADSHGATIRAVATSAVREANNRDVFVERVRAATGIDVEVISGEHEARLIYLGASTAVGEIAEQRCVLIDVGGGSTEVVLGERGTVELARSMRLGAVRLTDRYFPNGVVTPASIAMCAQMIDDTIGDLGTIVASFAPTLTLASSGTAETLTRVAQRATGCAIHPGFSIRALDTILAELIAHPTAAERATIAGLDAGRADIIVAGALVLQRFAHQSAIAGWRFSPGALRDGLVVDTLNTGQSGLASPTQME